MLRDARAFTQEDLAWVEAHYVEAFRLRSRAVSKRFGLAFDLMYQWSLASDERVALTLLWAALKPCSARRSTAGG